MSMFTPGQFVVCVDDSGGNPELQGLKSGKVYTVRDAGKIPDYDVPVVWLQEIVRSWPTDPDWSQCEDWPFRESRFRPISDTHEKIIEAMKEPVKGREIA